MPANEAGPPFPEYPPLPFVSGSITPDNSGDDTGDSIDFTNQVVQGI